MGATRGIRKTARRAGIAVAALLGVLVLAVVGARVFVTTAAGRALIEARLDGLRLGPVGVLKLEGLDGDPLGSVRVARLAIRDAEGVWLEAEDIEARWNPWALRRQVADIEALAAARVRLARRPTMAPRSEAAEGAPSRWSVRLDSLVAPEVALGEPVLGVAATLGVFSSIETAPGGVFTLNVDARRTDAPGDELSARAARAAAGRIEASAELVAPADGPLARLLQLPSQTLDANLTFAGTAAEGEAQLAATLDGARFVDLDGDWDAQGGQLEAAARFAAAPELDAVAARLGEDVRLALTLGPAGGARRTVTLSAESEALDLEAAGALDLARRTLPGGLDVTASTPRLDRLTGAQLESFEAGATRFEGRITLEDEAGEPNENLSDLFALRDVVVIDGTLEGDRVSERGWGADAVSGPAVVRYAREQRTLDVHAGPWDATGPRAPYDAVDELLGDALVLNADIAFDFAERVLRIGDVHAAGDAGEAGGSLTFAIRDQTLDAAFIARLADLAPAPLAAGGALDAGVGLSRAGPDAPVVIEVTGSTQALAMETETLDSLLRGALDLDLAMEIGGGETRIARASIDGDRVVLEGQGTIGPDAYDLAVDASAQGAVAAGPAMLDGAVVVAARLEGARDAPTLRLDARAEALDAGPAALTDARLRVELEDLLSAPHGRIAFDAESEEGPATASAMIATEDGAVIIEEGSASWRDYRLTANARRPDDGPVTGAFALTGLAGRLVGEGQATLTEGVPRVNVNATLRNQPIGEAGELAALVISASGPLDRIDLAASARGYAAGDFMLEASGRLEREDGATRLRLDPRGTVGDIALMAPEPWTAEIAGERTAARLVLTADGGALEASLERVDGETALAVRLDDAPLSLVNLVRPEPRLAGTVSASADLRGAETLEGTMSLDLADAHAPELIDAGRINLAVSVDQTAQGARVEATATDDAGFDVSASGLAPLVVRAWPPTPRFDRDAPVVGSGAAHGDIAALWALLGAAGVVVEGDVDVEGSLTGSMSEPTFEGAASVRDGRVEDVRLGLLVTDVNASARLDGPRLVIEEVEARDGGEGRATGSGAVEFGGAPGTETQVRMDLQSFQLLRASENSGVASGYVEVTRAEDVISIAGELSVDRADITPPERGAGGGANVPTLDVEEVNRPESLAPPPMAQREPIRFDLSVKADRRLFIRGRGLDSEWALDARLAGTSAAPEVFGAATLLRGDLAIAGERFILDAATITFNGPVPDAELDLTARNVGPDLTVIARITGTAAAPRIELQSTPSYPQGEILARMLYGRSASELSPLEAAQLATALASLAGAGGGGGLDLLGPIREGLGVDRLSLRTSETGAPLVAGGTYLADDVYLEVASSPTGGAEASIEWEIRPRLDLLSRFGAGQDAAVSLRWRYDY